MRFHPITGLFLEDGFGALADDLQAMRNHIPFIRRSQGDAAADAMLAKLQPPQESAPAPSSSGESAPAAPGPAGADPIEHAVAAAVAAPDGMVLPPAPAAEVPQSPSPEKP